MKNLDKLILEGLDLYYCSYIKDNIVFIDIDKYNNFLLQTNNLIKINIDDYKINTYENLVTILKKLFNANK